MNNWKIVAAVCLAVALVSYVGLARGTRDLALVNYVHKLNGSPSLLGRVVSADAGSNNNWGTAVPFSIPYGATLKLACPNLDSTYRAGQDGGVATANDDRLAGQTSAGLYPVPAEKVVTLASDENVVAFFPIDGGAAGCNVYEMR